MRAKTKLVNKPPAKSALAPVLSKARTPAKPSDIFSSVRPVNHGASPRGWHAIEAVFHCGKKFELQQRWGLRRPMTMTPDALGTGGLFHQGRAWWFSNNFATGKDAWDKLKTFVEEAALLYELPVKQDVINRTLSYLDQYCTYWSARVKPRVKEVEYTLTGNILGPDFDDRTARIDDLSEYPDNSFKLCIGECKTTSVSVKDAVEEYTVHGQPTKQAILFEAAPEGARKYGSVSDILLDVIVKGYGKEKCSFGRQVLRITDHMKNWYLPMLAAKVSEAQRIMDGEPGVRNITSCTRLIGRMRVPCLYRDLCQRGRSAAPAYVDRDGISLNNPKYTKMEGYKPWD